MCLRYVQGPLKTQRSNRELCKDPQKGPFWFWNWCHVLKVEEFIRQKQKTKYTPEWGQCEQCHVKEHQVFFSIFFQRGWVAGLEAGKGGSVEWVLPASLTFSLWPTTDRRQPANEELHSHLTQLSSQSFLATRSLHKFCLFCLRLF